MELNLKIRSNIQFCLLLGKSRKQTLKEIQLAYGENAPHRSTVYQWYDRFSSGKESLGDDPRSGRPTVRNEDLIQAVKDLIWQDRRITLREISAQLCESYGTIQRIVHDDLQYRRKCAKWIPKILTPEQKRARVETCMDFIVKHQEEGDEFLERIITCDETWGYQYDPENKLQSSQYCGVGLDRPKKAKVQKSASKVMFIVFFDIHGIILVHAVPTGVTVNSAYYSKLLRKNLKDAIRKKRPDFITDGFYFHHDNAPAHRANITIEVIHEHLQAELVKHPPYSPDTAPCDFHMFPEAKKPLRGIRFADDESLIEAFTNSVYSVAKNGLRHVFNDWIKRCNKCIAHGGDYFEGE